MCLVSFTVLDPAGNPYAGGLIEAIFTNNTGSNTLPLASGSVFQTFVVGELDSFGSGALTITGNDLITPAGTQWTFNVVDATRKIGFSTLITITGTTQNISAALQAAAAPLNPAVAFGNVTVTGLVDSGNLSVSGFATAKRFENRRYADDFPGATADIQITNAIADCPSTGGIVDATCYGATVQTIAAQLLIGSATKQITLLVDAATRFNVTITSGVDAIKVFNGSAIVSQGLGQILGGGSTVGGFFLTSTASVNTLLTNGQQDGTQEYIKLDGCLFQGHQTATVTTALVYLKQVFVNSIVQNCVIQGPMNGTVVKVEACGVIKWDNNWVNGSQGVGGLTVQAMYVNGNTTNMQINGGAIEHSTGTKPLLSIDSSTGLNSGVNALHSVTLNGTYLEGIAGTVNGIEITDASNVTIIGARSGGVAAGDFIKLIEGASGRVKGVILVSADNQSGTFTNTINDTTANAVGAQPITTAYISQYISNGQTFVGVTNTNRLTGAILSNVSATASGANNLSITLLNEQGPQAQLTGNSADQVAYTYTMPANTMAAGRGVKVSVWGQHSQGAAAVVYRIKFGGTSVFATSPTDTATVTEYHTACIFNNAGVTNAQHINGFGSLNNGGSNALNAPSTSAIDTTAPVVISFTFNVANTDKFTPAQFIVELIQ